MQNPDPDSNQPAADSSAEQPAVPSDSAARPKRRRSRSRPVPDTSVPSPCVAVCQYNSEDLCEGCLRTPDEIREWIVMSREQKLAVLTLLEQRRQAAPR